MFCKGLTKKGDPCRIHVKDSQYCVHHKPTELPTGISEKLLCKIKNQKHVLSSLHKRYEKTKALYKATLDANNELRRQLLLNEIKHDEFTKELNRIIDQLTSEVRKQKRELTVLEINAESYKELLHCEEFFDVLKKIRNKICPYLADRRFHIEFFVRNSKCLDTATRMLGLNKEELVDQFLQYKARRNALAHPVFEADINDAALDII